jgi:hypothetical protein
MGHHSVKYVRIYSDSSGASRLEEHAFSFDQRDYAPPGPPLNVTDVQNASSFLIARMPKGWSDDAHPAPKPEYVMVLSGSFELTASGESRTIRVGDIVLAEDCEGVGHGTRVLEEMTVAIVRK